MTESSKARGIPVVIDRFREGVGGGKRDFVRSEKNVNH